MKVWSWWQRFWHRRKTFKQFLKDGIEREQALRLARAVWP